MNGKYFFHDPSFSEAIPYRAITRYEHEIAKIEAMSNCSVPVMEFMADQAALTLEPIKTKELTAEEILEYQTYMFDLMVKIVYYGTRDFQKPEYSEQVIKDSYMDVLGLSQEILNASIRPKEEVIQLINSIDGKNLLTIHYNLGVPLTDAAWKLTPLQVQFLYKGKIQATAPKKAAPTITQEELSKDPEKVKEYLKAIFNG